MVLLFLCGHCLRRAFCSARDLPAGGHTAKRHKGLFRENKPHPGIPLHPFFYGAAGNLAWIFLFNGRLYIARDPLTYFVPILPFNWGMIDPACGGRLLENVQMWHLQLLRLIAAIIVWALSIATYRRIRRTFIQHGV